MEGGLLMADMVPNGDPSLEVAAIANTIIEDKARKIAQMQDLRTG